MGGPVDVPGQILGRPARLEQGLLQPAPLASRYDHGGVVDAGADQRGDGLGPEHLGEHGKIGGAQDQAVGRVDLEAKATVAGHDLGHVDQEGLGHGVARPAQQGVDHLLGVVAGGAGVPEAQRAQPVGVDVLGGALQLGERGDVGPARLGVGMVDLEQQRAVRLDNQRALGIRHNNSSSASVRTRTHSIRSTTNRRSSPRGKQVAWRFRALMSVGSTVISDAWPLL